MKLKVRFGLDELPVAPPDARAERLGVVDDLRARGRFAFADGAPHVHAVERFVLAELAASKVDTRVG